VRFAARATEGESEAGSGNLALTVQFDSYSDVDVLHVTDVEVPVPADDEVVVRVRSAGIYPEEAVIRKGYFNAVVPATFRAGQ